MTFQESRLPGWRRLATSAAAGAADAEALDAAFADAVRRTGASIGGLYLLSPDEEQLFLDVLYGAPAEFAAPWVRFR